ncbi:MAG: Asp23/Gls24 family envelope stress response protein [Chloroflexota bacterium]
MVLWRVEMEVADPEGPERSGRIAHGPPDARPDDAPPTCQQEIARVPTQPTAGRSLVTRRATRDLVRTATLGSYGVTGFAGQPLGRLLERLGLAQPGIVVRLGDTLDVELDLTVAYGVPVAEVARQVDSAVRYAIHRALGLEIRRLAIHIGGLRFPPGGVPSPVIHVDHAAVRPRDLADSGTDVV